MLSSKYRKISLLLFLLLCAGIVLFMSVVSSGGPETTPSAETSPQPPSSAEKEEEWPSAPAFPAATKVKVYLIDWSISRPASPIFEDRPDASAVPNNGIVLSVEQVAKLRSALADKHPEDTSVATCFDPHHEFVFEDASDKVVGVLDVCFECGGVDYRSLGFAMQRDEADKKIEIKYGKTDNRKRYEEREIQRDRIAEKFGIPPRRQQVNWKALEALIKELQLPVAPTFEDRSRYIKMKSQGKG